MHYATLSFMLPSIGIASGLACALASVTASYRRKRRAPSCQPELPAPAQTRSSAFKGSLGLKLKPAQSVLLGIPAALLCVAAHAADGDKRFVLAAYSNAPGGQEILSGHYQAALNVLDTKSSDGSFDAAYLSLNRCAALTMAAQWPAAQTACDMAVRYAHLSKLTHGGEGLQALHVQDEVIALAYTDRAVLESLTDHARAATQDLVHAKALLPYSDLVAQNVTALDKRSTLAKVTSAEQR